LRLRIDAHENEEKELAEQLLGTFFDYRAGNRSTSSYRSRQ
jgi:hypothetical protein